MTSIGVTRALCDHDKHAHCKIEQLAIDTHEEPNYKTEKPNQRGVTPASTQKKNSDSLNLTYAPYLLIINICHRLGEPYPSIIFLDLPDLFRDRPIHICTSRVFRKRWSQLHNSKLFGYPLASLFRFHMRKWMMDERKVATLRTNMPSMRKARREQPYPLWSCSAVSVIKDPRRK